MNFDPRITPARPDLAASFLEGKVSAARFVAGELREVIDPQAPVRREPRPDAALDTEALKGERVTIYETNEEGWAWGQLESDRYVGWLPANALIAPCLAPTHRVAALRMPVLSGPSIKMPTLEMLSFGATNDLLTDFAMFTSDLGVYVAVVVELLFATLVSCVDVVISPVLIIEEPLERADPTNPVMMISPLVFPTKFPIFRV